MAKLKAAMETAADRSKLFQELDMQQVGAAMTTELWFKIFKHLETGKPEEALRGIIRDMAQYAGEGNFKAVEAISKLMGGLPAGTYKIVDSLAKYEKSVLPTKAAVLGFIRRACRLAVGSSAIANRRSARD